jgi:hypothetical protein
MRLTIKKLNLFCLFLMAGFALQAQTDKMNIAKINVVSPFLGSLNLGFERVFTDKISAQVTFAYTGRKDKFEVNQGISLFGEARFYLSETNSAPLGFFLAPYLGYMGMKQNIEIPQVEADPIKGKADLNMFTLGLMGGYQIILKDIITVDIWGGPGFVAGKQTPDVDTKEAKPPFPYSRRTGLGGRAGICIGVAF